MLHVVGQKPLAFFHGSQNLRRGGLDLVVGQYGELLGIGVQADELFDGLQALVRLRRLEMAWRRMSGQRQVGLGMSAGETEFNRRSPGFARAACERVPAKQAPPPGTQNKTAARKDRRWVYAACARSAHPTQLH